MDNFSIPDRLDPVVPTENRRREGLSPDQRRRRNQGSLPRQVRDDDSDPPEDGEDLHNVDEHA
jgi:hypothetical protein